MSPFSLRVVDTQHQENRYVCTVPRVSPAVPVYHVNLGESANAAKYQVYPSDVRLHQLPIHENEVLCVFVGSGQDMVLKFYSTLEHELFPVFTIQPEHRDIYLCVGRSVNECKDLMVQTTQKQILDRLN